MSFRLGWLSLMEVSSTAKPRCPTSDRRERIHPPQGVLMTSRHRACLVPVALALLVTASGAHRTVTAQGSQSTVPSPEQFFGFQMGADRKLADWNKLHEYYQRLAKSSDKMRLVELGKTSEGRPYIALFISSPANLAKLDQYKQTNARLADPRGLTE